MFLGRWSKYSTNIAVLAIAIATVVASEFICRFLANFIMENLAI